MCSAGTVFLLNTLHSSQGESGNLGVSYRCEGQLTNHNKQGVVSFSDSKSVGSWPLAGVECDERGRRGLSCSACCAALTLLVTGIWKGG